ncbi:MAG TPA: hypothetical protein VHB97_26705 [Polyangia bacterium]|nr:hypothetical protein [Polyangia bacterium]
MIRPPRKTRSSRALAFAKLALVAACAMFTLAVAGCATTGRARPDGQLAVACNVGDARVYLDEVFLGRAADLRGHVVNVRSGSRRVELRADGWFPAYRDVAVPHAGRADLRVDLRPVPPNEPSE